MISVIVPCYNSARFIEDVYKSISYQKINDLEVIIVDDGSVDGTDRKISEISNCYPFITKYYYQNNAGAYAARVAGLAHCSGDLIAFYDCDDIWCDYHLKQCRELLTINPDIDWVYGPVKRVIAETGDVVIDNSFFPGQKALPFLDLKVEKRKNLSVFDDHRLVQYAIQHGLFAGLHSSLIRRRVFETVKMRSDLRNGEDRFFPIRAIKYGFKLGYVTEVQEIYRIHSGNTSAVGDKSVDHKLRVYENLLRGYRDLFFEIKMTHEEKKILKRKISDIQYWIIGYSLLWKSGRYKNSFRWLVRGAWNDKWNLKKWLRLFAFSAKHLIG